MAFISVVFVSYLSTIRTLYLLGLFESSFTEWWRRVKALFMCMRNTTPNRTVPICVVIAISQKTLLGRVNDSFLLFCLLIFVICHHFRRKQRSWKRFSSAFYLSINFCLLWPLLRGRKPLIRSWFGTPNCSMGSESNYIMPYLQCHQTKEKRYNLANIRTMRDETQHVTPVSRLEEEKLKERKRERLKGKD